MSAMADPDDGNQQAKELDLTNLTEEDMIFDPDATFLSESTRGDLTYKTYMVESFVTNPVIGENWAESGNTPSENFYRMYIHVPVKYGNTEFDEASLRNAPMMFKVNWGGERSTAPSATSAFSDQILAEALNQGFVVVDPGMLGVNCISEKDGERFNYGKIPYPIASLKAAVRYLRYESNETVIPGDKERIFATGTSSGGAGTTTLAASGNSPLYDKCLEEIGALPGRDDVFGTHASCPVVPRDYGDDAVAWERFFWQDFDAIDKEGLTEFQQRNLRINEGLRDSFIDYFPTMGLTANFTTDGVSEGDLLTTDNLKEYYLPYLKSSIITHLNNLGSREAIDAYIAASRGDQANNPLQNPMVRSDLITPVFDEDGVTVIDIDCDAAEFWETYIDYVYRDRGFSGYVRGKDPTVVDFLIDSAYASPNIGDNAILGPEYETGIEDGVTVTYINRGSYAYGKPNDWAASFSPFGLKWITENTNSTISDEYRAYYKMQTDTINPLNFVLNSEELGADVAPNWYIRTGAADTVTPPVMFLSLTTGLVNKGYNVNSALVWDQGHGQTSDWRGFFEWAKTIAPEPTKQREDLENLITSVEGLSESTYTVNSWNAMQDAIALATEALADENATAASLQEAIDALSEAIDALVLRAYAVQLNLLQGVVNDFAALSAENYPSDTWAVVSGLIKKAQGLLADPANAGRDETIATWGELLEAYSNLKATDKSLLVQAIETAKGKLADEDKYVPVAIENLRDALSDAEAVFNNPSATQDEIDNAWRDLMAAILTVGEKGDKGELEALLMMADLLKEDDYRAASWSAFADAYELADKTYRDVNADIYDVEDAIIELYEAMMMLERRADRSNLALTIDYAEEILANADSYAPASIAGLAEELGAAKYVYNNTEASQADYDGAQQRLYDQILKAYFKANKDALASALTRALLIDTAMFSPASVGVFFAALADAQALFTDENAPQNAVDEQTNTLKQATDALVPLAGSSGGTDSGDKENKPGGVNVDETKTPGGLGTGTLPNVNSGNGNTTPTASNVNDAPKADVNAGRSVRNFVGGIGSGASGLSASDAPDASANGTARDGISATTDEVTPQASSGLQGSTSSITDDAAPLAAPQAEGNMSPWSLAAISAAITLCLAGLAFALFYRRKMSKMQS